MAHTMIGLAPYSESGANLPEGDWPYWKPEEPQVPNWDPAEALARIKRYNREHDGESS